jgi:predicted dehydrogenase
MNNALGIGVIGMGWMGRVHSRAYRQVADRFSQSGIRPRLVICADEVDERAREAQQMFGFEQRAADWREVAAHPDVHVVNIASPNHLHVEMVRFAAEHGKHIFCEKPVGRSPQETALIESLARRAGVRSFVGYNYRWAPMVQYARQLLAAGRLGPVTHYRGRFFSMYGSNPHGQLTWRFDRSLAGMGTLGDIMSHVIDMAAMLVGPVRRLVSSQHTFIPQRPLPVPGRGTHFSVGQSGDPQGQVTNEDYVGALVEFENGARGSLEVCRAIFGPKCEMAFELNGTQGALAWNFERMNELKLYLPEGGGAHEGYTTILAGPDHPPHGHFNPGPGIGMSYDDLKTIEAYQFLKSIVDGADGAPGFREALAVANVQSAMQCSWETGSWEDVVSLQVD